MFVIGIVDWNKPAFGAERAIIFIHQPEFATETSSAHVIGAIGITNPTHYKEIGTPNDVSTYCGAILSHLLIALEGDERGLTRQKRTLGSVKIVRRPLIRATQWQSATIPKNHAMSVEDVCPITSDICNEKSPAHHMARLEKRPSSSIRGLRLVNYYIADAQAWPMSRNKVFSREIDSFLVTASIPLVELQSVNVKTAMATDASAVIRALQWSNFLATYQAEAKIML